MKKVNTLFVALILCTGAFLLAFNSNGEKQYEFTSFTVVESIVPSGLGRSRIISSLEEKNYQDYTSERTGDFDRNESSRQEIRVKNFEETKLLNFYNLGGIRFQNIAANDALINSKVNAMLNQGWELKNVVSGVEAVGSKDDANGIYITRFYFQRNK
ncbi:MAG: hypothetical protein KDC92_08755 [Bacteroidetes bacterium]|nr:hypothetical protein [Bacteroidota bacterium]